MQRAWNNHFHPKALYAPSMTSNWRMGCDKYCSILLLCQDALLSCFKTLSASMPHVEAVFVLFLLDNSDRKTRRKDHVASPDFDADFIKYLVVGLLFLSWQFCLLGCLKLSLTCTSNNQRPVMQPQGPPRMDSKMKVKVNQGAKLP